jgi:hypothetical protein
MRPYVNRIHHEINSTTFQGFRRIARERRKWPVLSSHVEKAGNISDIPRAMPVYEGNEVIRVFGVKVNRKSTPR